MSRLALPPRNKTATVALGLGVQPTSGASRQHSGAARPGAPVSGAADARQSSSSDSEWGSGDDSDQNNGLQQAQKNEQQQQQAASSRQRVGPVAPTPQTASGVPARASPAEAVPPFGTPRSEVYDVGDSSDDDWRATNAKAPRAGAASKSASAPANAGALKPVQPGSAARPHQQDGKLGSQPKHATSQDFQHRPKREQPLAAPASAQGPQGPLQQAPDCIPAHRPCHQQQQQPPPPQQHQRPHAQVLSARSAASTRLERPPQEMRTGQPQQAEQRQRQQCPVCEASISHLQLQQQVAHVKACMAGRGVRHPQHPQQQQQQQQHPKRPAPSRSTAQQALRQPAVRSSSVAAPARPAAAPGSVTAQQRGSLLSPDIGEWLRGLGLGQYAATFEAEELDLHVMHAVTTDELAGIGVADAAHRERIVQAAQEAAAQLGLGRARTGGAPPAAPVQATAKKQRHLTDMMAQAAAHGGPSADGGGDDCRRAPAQDAQPAGAQPAGSQRWDRLEQQRQQQQRSKSADSGQRDEGSRPKERALLATLYPSRQQTQQGTAARAQQQQQQQRTPELPLGRYASRAVTQPLLWQGAASCMPAGPTLAARLAQREAEQAQGAGAGRQPLARGGTAYPAAEESRALKRLKLEALRQELRHHEATAAELRRMIQGLEREVEGGG